MLNNYLKTFVLCICIAVLLGGCSSRYVVVDRSGMTFNLRKVKLAEGNTFEVLDGEAVRVVPVNSIFKLVLDPSKTHYYENKLYYHAVVELVDGTVIKPRKTEGTVTKSFVMIHNQVIGKAATGTVKIPLEDVNVLSQADVE